MKIQPTDQLRGWLNTPLLIDETSARELQRLVGANVVFHKSAMTEEAAAFPSIQAFVMGDRRPYTMSDGVAQINVKGFLEHDSFYYGSHWTGYDALKARFDMALEDPDVNGIAFMINSSGGEVAGNFDLVDYIHDNRGRKPTMAIVNESAFSAAYSIASAADRIMVNRTGAVGSIGIITVHMDQSKMLEDIGVKPTLIFAGKHKADGNPYEPLTPEVAGEIQSRVDGLYTIFVDTVARNRGISSDTVRATEAGVFSGEEAVDIGLADGVMSAGDALNEFKSELTGSTTGGHYMSEQNQPEAGAQSGEHITQEVFDAAVASAAEGGEERGATAERERILAILNSEEAVGREATALTLAENPDMSAEAAVQVLASIEVVPPGKHDPLGAAMDATGGGAGVTAGGEGADDPQPSLVTIDQKAIYDNWNKQSA